MTLCKNCGSQIPEGKKFCPECGQPAVDAAGAAAPVIPEQTAAPEPEAPPQKGSYTIPQPGSYTPPQPVAAPEPKAAAPQPAAAPEPKAVPQQDSSTPSTQGSYTPSAPQASEPVPAASAQSSYTPPVTAGGQSYTPPQPAYTAPAVSPREKKPVNKKLFFIIGGVVLAVILVIVLISALGGKGGSVDADDPNQGLYTASSAQMMGMDISVADLWSDGFTIELQNKGKCVMDIDGTTAKGKWSLDNGVFHIKGGGLDCDGVLSGGQLVLTNVLDMGVDLTFVKAGGAGDAVSDLRTQWNGTWFGSLYISDTSGDYEQMMTGNYDAFMMVEVDGSGKGHFTVYLSGVDEAFATASCTASESGLTATEGLIAGKQEMDAYNWMLLPMPDYPDQFVMSDSISDDGGSIDMSLFMKKWGHSWQEEIDSDFAIVPPSVLWYEQAIINGELPPEGYAPQGQVASRLPNAFGGYLPYYEYCDAVPTGDSWMGQGGYMDYEGDGIALHGDWYGWIKVSDAWGEYADFFEDATAKVGYNSDYGMNYIDVYRDKDSETPVFSMWIEEDPTDTHIIPVIGDHDAWILNTYLTADDAYYFETSIAESGMIYYYYSLDSGASGATVEICLRPLGAEWNEDYDILPPGYAK